MAHAWVLVANQSEARLFEAEKRSGELHELESMIYPQSRMSGRDLISDAPGRTFDSGGQGRHAMGKTEQLHRLSGRKFAR